MATPGAQRGAPGASVHDVSFELWERAVTHRVYFLNKLHEGVDPAAYEEWIRTSDYPVARANPAIVSYDVTRIESTLDGAAKPSVDYLEVLEVTSLEEYQRAIATPEVEKLLGEWSTFVASAEVVHGPVVE